MIFAITRNMNRYWLDRITSFNLFAAVLVAIALGCTAPAAQAGVIRHTGKMVLKGTTVAATATASGGEVAANKTRNAAVSAPGTIGNAAVATGHAVASAGKTTATGVGNGAVAVSHGVAKTPGALAHGATAVWHVVW